MTKKRIKSEIPGIGLLKFGRDTRHSQRAYYARYGHSQHIGILKSGFDTFSKILALDLHEKSPKAHFSKRLCTLYYVPMGSIFGTSVFVDSELYQVQVV